MKICLQCKIEKNESEYNKKRNGLNAQCKKCVAIRQKLNKKDSPEIRAERNKKAKEARKKESFKEWRKAYREKNKEKIAKQVHENYLKNRDSVLTRTKKWRQDNKEKFYEYWKKSTSKHPLQHSARKILNYAIEYGKIEKPKICELCQQEGKLQAHHEDYTKPLQVKWICSSCHGYIHRTFK